MPRGRKPKTPEQQLREGDPGQKGPGAILREGTPASVGGLFPDELREAPEHLSELGKRAYMEFVDDLKEAGIIDRGDRGTIIAAANAVGRAVEAGEWVNEFGMLYCEVTLVWSERRQEEVECTKLKANPAVGMERQAWAEFRHLAEVLGLSPVGRTRLGRAGVQGRPIDTELNKRGAGGAGDDEPLVEHSGELPDGVISFADVARRQAS